MTAQQLKEDVNLLLQGFDDGVFVRNTDDDDKPGWALKILPYISAMARLKRWVDS